MVGSWYYWYYYTSQRCLSYSRSLHRLLHHAASSAARKRKCCSLGVMARCLHSDKRPGCTILYCCTTMCMCAMCLATSMIHPRHAMSTLQLPAIIHHSCKQLRAYKRAGMARPTNNRYRQARAEVAALSRLLPYRPAATEPGPLSICILTRKASHRSPEAYSDKPSIHSSLAC
jgi:hypothetical protein